MVESTKYDENMGQTEFERLSEILTQQRNNVEWEEPQTNNYSALDMARPVSLGPIKQISDNK